MRLLLVFLAACGSSSVGVSSAPLEQDLTSAPVPAPAPDAAEESSACYCPEVTVRCGTTGAFHARMDRATCTLDLPKKGCALFGLETGAKARPEEILAAPAPIDPSADDVFELCGAKHEAHHACDRSMDAACAFEVSAYDVSLECMRPFVEDEKVARDLETVIAAREMNACLCEETACAVCAERCRADHPDAADTCAQARAVYCD